MNNKLRHTRSKAATGSKDLPEVVDEVLNEYCKYEHQLPIAAILKNFEDEKIGVEVIMKSESIVINEMNAALWDKALNTSLADITAVYCPHYIVIQKFINYILNSSMLDIGVVKTLFSKLLLFHPPNTVIMHNYYWHILNDKYVKFNNVDEEDKNVLWCVVEALISCSEILECLAAIPEDYYQEERLITKNEILEFAEGLDKKKGKKGPLSSKNNSNICFDSLSSTDKCQRILIILEFVSDILEVDFTYRMKANQLNVKENRCFLSSLLWENVGRLNIRNWLFPIRWEIISRIFPGTTNSAARKIIRVFQVMEPSALGHGQQVHRKLMKLLGEVVRLSDTQNNLYPFFGNNSDKLTCDFSLKFLENLTENYKPENMIPIKMLRPHWLRLLVSSKLLSYITGKLCDPELSTVHDILAHILDLNARRRASRVIRRSRHQKSIRRQKNDNFNLDINYCYSSCSLRDGKEIKRRKLSEEDLNALDNKGWAVLHRAALLGHNECVENLLNYHSKNKKKKTTPDVKLKGFKNFTPLMCAAVAEQGNVCRLLLEHSGPKLLEDIDIEGNTAFDLCQDNDIIKIMKSFRRIKSSSESGQKFHITLDDIQLVIDLCVQLVESYFITHRTREVQLRSKLYKCSEGIHKKIIKKKSVKWDYLRYQTDIHVNLTKLSELLKKFIRLKEFKKSLEPLNLLINYSISF